MLERHTTSDGTTMLVAQMADSHLMNTINVILRRMREVQSTVGIGADMSDFDKAFYGVQEVSEQEAASVMRAMLKRLYPYLAEAYLRDLGTPRVALAEMLGRDCALSVAAPLSLPSGSEEWGTRDEDEHPW